MRDGESVSVRVCVCVCVFTYVRIFTYKYLYKYTNAHVDILFNSHKSSSLCFPLLTSVLLIIYQVGVAYVTADVRTDAESSFRESILHNQHNIKAMIGLAQIHR